MTLIGTAGHLHPGGLRHEPRGRRAATSASTLFTSKAHYYEPAGEVSWDVAMGATPADWRVKLQAGDKLSVHATYDTSRASWYEVMGIMPVAVYNGTDVGGVGAFSTSIPQERRADARPPRREPQPRRRARPACRTRGTLPDGPFLPEPVESRTTCTRRAT